MTLRAILKGCVERGLVWSGVAALRRATSSGRCLVLAYHNVVPDDTPPFGDQSLHLTRRAFTRQLDTLLRTHTVVPLAEIFEPPARRGGRLPVALTFDDGYRGAVVIGAEELAKRGLPATFFVVPGFLSGGPYWWDALSADRSGLSAKIRDHALRALRGEGAAVLSWAREQALPTWSVPDCAMVASLEDLQSAVRHSGLTVGSHSWSHCDLTSLDATELRNELERPLAWLRDRCSSVIPWLSYPYGLHSAAVETAARHAGYVAAANLGGSRFTARDVGRYVVPRLNIPATLSGAGFTVWTSGVLDGAGARHRPERAAP